MRPPWVRCTAFRWPSPDLPPQRPDDIGRPCPTPGYPAATAFYPVPVRRVQRPPPASFRPRLATMPLPLAACSCHQGPQGTYAPLAILHAWHTQEIPFAGERPTNGIQV